MLKPLTAPLENAATAAPRATVCAVLRAARSAEGSAPRAVLESATTEEPTELMSDGVRPAAALPSAASCALLRPANSPLVSAPSAAEDSCASRTGSDCSKAAIWLLFSAPTSLALNPARVPSASADRA